ncbi:MAG: hypothetical protein WA581_13710 [Candidatus Acidiferrales bacterium]
MKRKQRDEAATSLVPPSEETSGLELDPGCNDQSIPASPITMMSPAGERNAKKAGEQINYRTGTTIRRQP